MVLIMDVSFVFEELVLVLSNEIETGLGLRWFGGTAHSSLGSLYTKEWLDSAHFCVLA